MKKNVLSLIVLLCIVSEGLHANSTIPLTLDNFIKEVVKRNPNMIFDRMQSDIIANQVSYEKAIFIPRFNTNLTHVDSNTPNNTERQLSQALLSTYSEVSDNVSFGLSGLLPTGAKWDATITSTDRQSSLIEKYKEYNTEYQGNAKISLSQPVLKGFGSDITLAKYHLAKADENIFDKQYQKKVSDVMGSAIEVYWKYYSTKEIEKSYKKSLKINKALVTLLQAKVKGGNTAQSEVLEAQTITFIREAELKKIEAELLKIKNRILTLLNVSVANNTDVKFILNEKVNVHANKNLSVDYYHKKAMIYYPDYKIANEKLKKEQFQLKVTKNQILPQLDLFATVSTDTLSNEREYKVIDKNFLSWSVGLQFNMPILSDRESNLMEIEKLKERQAKLEVATLDKNLYNAIVTKLKELSKSREEVEFYERGVSLKEKLYSYTQQSLELGHKSMRDLLEQEKDLLEYKRRLYRVIVDWKLAEASLDSAVGILFEKYLPSDTLYKIKNKKHKDRLSSDNFGKL